LLRAARALFRCCSRPEVIAQWLSRNFAIGLKTTCASAACLEAALEESRRAACRGPLLLRLFEAILLLARLVALLVVAVGVVLRSDRA
jgi:hypothetical protein